MAPTIAKKPKTKLKDLEDLGQRLLSSRTHINNLPLLLNFISPSSPPQFFLEVLLSLQAFFTTVLPELPSSSNSVKRQRAEESAKGDPELIYRTWLRSKFDEFLGLLVEALMSPEPEEPLKEVILDTYMEFVKLGNRGRFDSSIYHKLLRSIINSETPADFCSEMLASKYSSILMSAFFDVTSMEKLDKALEGKDIRGNKKDIGESDGTDGSNSRISTELSIHKMHYFLSHIPSQEGLDEKSEQEMWSGSEKSSQQLGSDIKAAGERLSSAIEDATMKELKTKVAGELRKLTGLSSLDRHKAAIKIGCDGDLTMQFFTIDDEEKEEWIQALLSMG